MLMSASEEMPHASNAACALSKIITLTEWSKKQTDKKNRCFAGFAGLSVDNSLCETNE